MHELLDIRKACTYSTFLQLIEKAGPLLNWPFLFPSENPDVIPVMGYDFLECAKKLSKTDHRDEINFFLDFLYFRALYDPAFKLPIMFNGNIIDTAFAAGSGWMENCRLGPFRKYKYMVVGKCPAVQDFYYGKITFGPSVKILLSALKDCGFTGDTSDFYLTTVVKHGLLDPSSTALKSNWIKNCAPLLKLEMALTRPDYILLTGDEAVKAVLGKDQKLAATTGIVFDVDIPVGGGEFHRAKAVASVSPAYVARYPEASERFNSSVKHFVSLINNTPYFSSETGINHIDVRSAEELALVRDEILKESVPVVAVDLEWHGEWPSSKGAYIRTVQLSWKAGHACSIVINKAGGGVVFEGGLERLKELLNEIFFPKDGRKVRVVGHYLTADLPWLKSLGVDLSSIFEAPDNDEITSFNPADMASFKFGFEKTKFEGGFDTLLAAHSVNETDIFNLEEQAVRYCGVPRWEGPILRWRKQYCKENNLSDSELGGYGNCPDDVLIPYGCYDADVTRRLYDYFNGVGDKPGRLDSDRYGNNCRLPFWLSMRAYPAFIEMRQKGILIDKARVQDLTDLYTKLYSNLIEKLRTEIKWPDFNPSSSFHKRELLFGEELSGRRDSDGKIIKQRPAGAVSLGITPYKSTGLGSKGKLWSDIVARGEESMYKASADKESLSILSDMHPIIGMLRDIRSLHYLRTSVLRGPDCDKDGNERTDDDGELVYDRGILSYVHDDDRVRSMFSQTKETGRASSSRPNMQNLGKTIEDKYKSIFKSYGSDLGLKYTHPLRSVISAKPGTVLVEADYTGAELAIMAWQSNDHNMIDHVRRANLPEDDPEYYDIHSNVAVNTFRLSCPPTKKGLKEAGKAGLRTAAKAVVFGYAYGQGAESTARKAKQEGVIISVDEAQELIDGLVAMYPRLPVYFNECKSRVTNPGWVCNAFGRYRRFAPSNDRAVVAEYERQSMNFPIQSSVADAMSCALDHIYNYRKTAPAGMHYDIILQVHDAVLLEVPYECVSWVVEDVLPTCMSEKVSIYSCGLDGKIRAEGGGPYHLGIATEVFTKWSIPLTKDDCKVMGIPDRFAQH
jgi:uracil-DNA glycosylase family 4